MKHHGVATDTGRRTHDFHPLQLHAGQQSHAASDKQCFCAQTDLFSFPVLVDLNFSSVNVRDAVQSLALGECKANKHAS